MVRIVRSSTGSVIEAMGGGPTDEDRTRRPRVSREDGVSFGLGDRESTLGVSSAGFGVPRDEGCDVGKAEDPTGLAPGSFRDLVGEHPPPERIPLPALWFGVQHGFGDCGSHPNPTCIVELSLGHGGQDPVPGLACWLAADEHCFGALEEDPPKKSSSYLDKSVDNFTSPLVGGGSKLSPRVVEDRPTADQEWRADDGFYGARHREYRAPDLGRYRVVRLVPLPRLCASLPLTGARDARFRKCPNGVGRD